MDSQAPPLAPGGAGARALLEALAAQDSRRDLMLLLCGEGEERGQLEAGAGRLGIAGRVRFLGSRADVPELLAASDVFVLPCG